MKLFKLLFLKRKWGLFEARRGVFLQDSSAILQKKQRSIDQKEPFAAKKNKFKQLQYNQRKSALKITFNAL
jgi:hypothetical protein